MDLEKLSISDLIALADYVQKLRVERINDLKSQDLEWSNDKSTKDFEKLEFDIHTRLFSIIVKLKNH